MNNKTKRTKKMLDSLEAQISNKAHIGYLISDPTRLKMLLILKENKKLCTSELARILDVSVSAVSHQKTILEHFGLIDSAREGQKICCILKDIKKVDEVLAGIK